MADKNVVQNGSREKNLLGTLVTMFQTFLGLFQAQQDQTIQQAGLREKTLFHNLVSMFQQAQNQDIQQAGLREKNLLYIIADILRRVVNYATGNPRLYVVADINTAQTLTTVTTVTTVGAVTNITNWGVLTAYQQTMYETREASDLGPRSRVNSF